MVVGPELLINEVKKGLFNFVQLELEALVLILGIPGDSAVKNLTANAGNAAEVGLIPGSGRSLGGGHDDPFQYSCLKNSHGQRSLAGYSPLGHSQTWMKWQHGMACSYYFLFLSFVSLFTLIILSYCLLLTFSFSSNVLSNL